MEYTVQKLGQLAHISTRTLRYYDEVGILKPARISSSGYRIYGEREVARLQQILFYRELGIGLESIKDLVLAPDFDGVHALKEHHEKLLEKREQLDALIKNVEKTIATSEGRITMSDKERFEGFKKKMVEDNENKYGKEIREKYGEEKINRSNQRVLNMTQEEHDVITKLGEDVISTLLEAFKTGDPASLLAQEAVTLHQKWLNFYWNEYSLEAHKGLGEMYVADERFKEYYDKHQVGLAEFLRDAIYVFADKQQSV